MKRTLCLIGILALFASLACSNGTVGANPGGGDDHQQPGDSASGGDPATSSHYVDLSWTASTSTVVGYFAYRGSADGGPYTKLNSASVPDLTFRDVAVTAGQTYYYVVTAVDANSVESAYSNQASAAIPSP